MEQINATLDPLLAMAEIQGAVTVMGTYVNKLASSMCNTQRKYKTSKQKCITLQKDQIEEEHRSKAQKVKHLEAKVRKTETELQNAKEKVSYLKPENVKR